MSDLNDLNTPDPIAALQDAIWYAEQHRNDHGIDWLLRTAQTVLDEIESGNL